MHYSASAVLAPEHHDPVDLLRLMPTLGMQRCSVQECPDGHIHVNAWFDIDNSVVFSRVLAGWDQHLRGSVAASFHCSVRVLEHRVNALMYGDPEQNISFVHDEDGDA